MKKALHVYAPAKINLTLHVTGRRDDGYHTLHSLVSFADVGDEVRIFPPSSPRSKNGFEFEVSGPFAHAFNARDLDASPASRNLVVRAVWGLAQLCGYAPDMRVELVKNLPLGAGLGGGSSDAAAVVWGLLEYWDLPRDLDGLNAFLLSLGADVPVCFACRDSVMRGIGDVLDGVPALPEVSCLLVYPGQVCDTQAVFAQFGDGFSAGVSVPEYGFNHAEDLISYLRLGGNDLGDAARGVVPEIGNVLHALRAQSGVELARMSGSGACCFALFNDDVARDVVARSIGEENPDWWVAPCFIGRVARY